MAQSAQSHDGGLARVGYKLARCRTCKARPAESFLANQSNDDNNKNMQPIDINIRQFGDGFTAQITNRNLPGGNGPGQQVTQHIGTTVAEIVGKLTKDLAALPETYPPIPRPGAPA